MYKSLQIKDFDFSTAFIPKQAITDYKNRGKALLKPLKKYLLDKSDSNIFSADKIQEQLFAETEADIFLSHAHADEDDVIRLAVYLEKHGVKVFVDSCVWGSVFELLQTIDETYSKIEENLYSYKSCLSTSANVYMILNTALHKMIDRAELFLFLGTESSVTVSDTMVGRNESVRSPWIYSELMFANQVRRIKKREIVSESLSEKYESKIIMDSMPEFDYKKPKLDYSISNDKFEKWLESIKLADNKHKHPLDKLYSLIG